MRLCGLYTRGIEVGNRIATLKQECNYVTFNMRHGADIWNFIYDGVVPTEKEERLLLCVYEE